MSIDEEFILELRQDFLLDSVDLRLIIRDSISKFKQEPEKSLDELLRALHNLKGQANAVGLNNTASLFHDSEQFFVKIREIADISHSINEIQKLFLNIFMEIESRFEKLSLDLKDDPPYLKDQKYKIILSNIIEKDSQNHHNVALSQANQGRSLDSDNHGQVINKSSETLSTSSNEDKETTSNSWGSFDRPSTPPVESKETSSNGWGSFDRPSAPPVESKETSSNSWGSFDRPSAPPVEAKETSSNSWGSFDRPTAPPVEAKETSSNSWGSFENGTNRTQNPSENKQNTWGAFNSPSNDQNNTFAMKTHQNELTNNGHSNLSPTKDSFSVNEVQKITDEELNVNDLDLLNDENSSDTTESQHITESNINKDISLENAEKYLSKNLNVVRNYDLESPKKPPPEKENSSYINKSEVSNFYLNFEKNSHNYLLHTKYISQLVEYIAEKENPLPRKSKLIESVINYRGNLVPILRLEKYPLKNEEKILIICEIDNNYFAIKVNDANILIQLEDNQIQKLEKNHSSLNNKLISGLVKRDDTSYMVFEPSRLLD